MNGFLNLDPDVRSILLLPADPDLGVIATEILRAASAPVQSADIALDRVGLPR